MVLTAVKVVSQLPENLPAAATRRRVRANAELSVSERDMERSRLLIVNTRQQISSVLINIHSRRCAPMNGCQRLPI
jgi:hypothetical protein